MKISKTTLTLTLLGILTLIILSQTKTIQTGTISEIKISSNKIIITLQNKTAELVIFDNINLNLNPNDKIKFKGKPSTYKNKEQIIIEKLSILK